MVESNYLSQKFKILSFLSSIMVVFIHAYSLHINIKGITHSVELNVFSFIQSYIINLFQIAVPMFFMISGYFVFYNITVLTFKNFIGKIKKRFRTLIIPFIFWSILYIFFLYLLQLLPEAKIFYTTGKFIQDFSLKELIQGIFECTFYPPFWYLRNLIVCIILSPLIYFALRINHYIIIGLLFIFWFFNPGINLAKTAFFYTLGVFWGIKKGHLKYNFLNHKYLELMNILWFVLLFCETYISFQSEISILYLCLYLASINTILGIVVVWLNYDYYVENSRYKVKLIYISSYSFFIYVTHYWIVKLIVKVILKNLGVSSQNTLLSFILSSIFTIIFIILILEFFKRYFPKFLSVIMGQRV